MPPRKTKGVKNPPGQSCDYVAYRRRRICACFIKTAEGHWCRAYSMCGKHVCVFHKNQSIDAEGLASLRRLQSGKSQGHTTKTPSTPKPKPKLKTPKKTPKTPKKTPKTSKTPKKAKKTPKTPKKAVKPKPKPKTPPALTNEPTHDDDDSLSISTWNTYRSPSLDSLQGSMDSRTPSLSSQRSSSNRSNRPDYMSSFSYINRYLVTMHVGQDAKRWMQSSNPNNYKKLGSL